MKIKYVDFGIANNFGSFIEINRNLKKYPHLLKPILKHELSHTNKFFSLKDFKLDFYEDSEINIFDMLKFMFKHPKSFSQVLPVYWTKKKGFVYDINLIVMYLMMVIIFTVTIWAGMKFL